jgi:hypothetical protein
VPLPGSVSTATISETYLDATGAPDKGTVTLTPTTRVTVAGTSITLGRVVGKVVNGVLLGPDGINPLIVAGTDDTDLSPAGWAYRIEERVGRIDKTYIAFIPAGAVTLHSLAPIEEPPEGSIVVKTVEGVGPDATGNIDLNLAGGGPHTHPQSDVTNLSASLAGKENVGIAAGLVTTHEGASNPHPTYLTQAEGDAAYSAIGHSHGGGSGIKAIRRAIIANPGDTTLPNSPATWVAVTGFELSIPAAVDDEVELLFNAMRNNNASAVLDVAVIVGTELRRFGANNSGSPALEGNPAFYHTNTFTGHSGGFDFKVVANDLDGGNIRFVMACKSNGTGTLFSSTNYPFRWRALNYGPITG